MWIYRHDPHTTQWHVGYLTPDGLEIVERYPDRDEARRAVHYLNGGKSG